MTTLTINRPEGNLVADRIGTGPAIVLVPGLGDLRIGYRHLAPKLAEAGFTVYSLDLRGHGDSDATFTTYTPEDIAADMLALLDQEGLEKATIVGNSIAGGAATFAAVQDPGRIERIVLLNPFVRDMPADRFLRPMVPLMFARPWGAWAWVAYRKTLFISPPDDNDQVAATLKQTLSDPARLGAVRSMIRASKAGIALRLGEVRANTLVVIGDQDPDYSDPAAEGQTLAELLGGPTRVAMVEESGHYPQTEHADQVAALVLDHIRSGATNAT